MYSDPIFVVSTGRAGSKMLAKTLALHPELFAVHEPIPNLNPESYGSWKGDDTIKIGRKIKQKRAKLIRQVKENNLIYIESSHYCSHLIPYLAKYFNAKFIFLYRDGRNFVRSGLERKAWYPPNMFKHPKYDSVFIELIKRSIRRKLNLNIGYSWDDHRLKPPKACQTRIEKISWLWNEINKTILDSLSAGDYQYMAVKLEDFEREALGEIGEFIGVDLPDGMKDDMVRVSEKRPNKTATRKVPDFNSWTDDEKTQFWRYAKPMMQQLNYIEG